VCIYVCTSVLCKPVRGIVGKGKVGKGKRGDKRESGRELRAVGGIAVFLLKCAGAGVTGGIGRGTANLHSHLLRSLLSLAY